MSDILFLDKPFMYTGLGTLTYTVPTGTATQSYNVHVEVTEVPPSGLSIVVNKSGSPIFTAPALAPTQIAQQFKVSFQAASTNVITVVLSSASAIDSVINHVKATITLAQGAN